jgi:outer membrane protein OmpA-like peptidoglycan-associated protein
LSTIFYLTRFLEISIMAEHVKVYEEKKQGLPIWAWLLPLLLLLGLLAWWLAHRHSTEATAVAPVAATAGAFPDLGTVHFDTDQATLTPADKTTLDKAAAAMQSNPNARLRLEGYTDSTGTDPHNLTLSQQRANSVADYLKSKGIAGDRLGGGGFAAANPADTNATDAGKADNRRVELFTQQ